MSTIIIKINRSLKTNIIDPIESGLTSNVIEVTAKVLAKDPASIIVDYEVYEGTKPANAPDVLFRAETSPARRHLLKSWGEALLSAWHDSVSKKDQEVNSSLRVAAKTYVIDSEWIE